MKLNLLWILPFLIACTNNTNSNDIRTEALDSVSDTTLSEDTLPEIMKDLTGKDLLQHDIDAADTDVQSKSCKDQLTKYQCLKDSDCGQGNICAGVTSCGGKNCFGYCDVYPGTCLPQYKDIFCNSSADCAQDYTCLYVRDCKDSKCLASKIPGLCRYTGPGHCYVDTDCASGKYCAQASYCQSGPCRGQDLAGKCVTKPKDTSEGCLDNRDCPKQQECHDATLCTAFDLCTTQPGICTAIKPCNSAKDCSDPNYSFCEEAYKCNFDTCVYPTSDGYCIAGPGPSACWTDTDCSSKRPLCKGARPCRPGSSCDTSGKKRTGYCVASIPPKGLIFRMPDQIIAGQPFPVAIINYTGVTISVMKTYTFNYQQKKYDGTFIDRCPDPNNYESCIPAGPFIGINNGGAFTRMEKVVNPGTYKIQVDAYNSSVQGFKPENSIDPKYHLLMYESTEFTVQAPTGG